jgi:hypothetical protein
MMNQPIRRVDPLGRSTPLSPAHPSWPWAATLTAGSVSPICRGSERAIVDTDSSCRRCSELGRGWWSASKRDTSLVAFSRARRRGSPASAISKVAADAQQRSTPVQVGERPDRRTSRARGRYFPGQNRRVEYDRAHDPRRRSNRRFPLTSALLLVRLDDACFVMPEAISR